jgi:hypothetical protein
MASSIGASPPPPPCPDRARPARRGVGLILAACLAAAGARAALPAYLREALDHFSPEVPGEWAYTQTTIRNDLATTERFDPAQPPADRWTLLQYHGREPTGPDREKYQQFKASGPTTASQAAFRPGDIEPGSMELIREDSARAEFRCTFRAEAAGSDKMLGHLRLQLTVNKQQPHIEKYLLGLNEPYSPVLGVKMNVLTVEMSFSPPTPDRPSLPAVSSSHFAGRIFFIGTTENLQVSYSAYSRVR